MNDFKFLKEKEVVIGLIIIIILSSIALFLLIKREEGNQTKQSYKATEEHTEESAIMTIDSKTAESALAGVQVIAEEASEQMEEDESSILPLYRILGKQKYKGAALTERKQEDNQLKELYEYWDAYKLDAVEELVRLERMQKISEELKGKNKFYYHGSVDALGRPSGKGLAVYEDNTYYFGEWKDGLRHGKGTWLEVAIYTEENQDKNLGVIEHSYSGAWSKDLPNGEGHEHFSYDYSILQEEYVKSNECFTNVIGGFKDGYYHGEMYVISTDANGKIKEWSATCKNGVWEPFMVGSTTDAVFESYEKDENGNAEYHYMYPEDNKNFGIIGLKK